MVDVSPPGGRTTNNHEHLFGEQQQQQQRPTTTPSGNAGERRLGAEIILSLFQNFAQGSRRPKRKQAICTAKASHTETRTVILDLAPPSTPSEMISDMFFKAAISSRK